MRTTIALDAGLRDRLAALRDRWGASSIEAVLERLLAGPPLSAQALYETRKRAVDAVLARHGVRRMVAFGSRARGDARPDSDLDLAVVLPRSADLFDLVRLRADLEDAFGLPVQVVSLPAAPARLRARIDAEGVTLAR